MIEKVIGCALEGIEAQKVEVEVNVSRGAKFLLVGLPDNADPSLTIHSPNPSSI